MVSSTLLKLSSPVAKSTLIALGSALFIDAILTILAGVQYPYLIDYYNDDLYIVKSRTIAIGYLAISIAAIIVAISTALACYKSNTNYVLIHAGITGIFLPVIILVYFSTISARYKASDYVEDYYLMIDDYRISAAHKRQAAQGEASMGHDSNHVKEPTMMLSSFINLIDSMQTKFSCCGVESAEDWTKRWDGYIPPSCCRSSLTSTNDNWAKKFSLDDSIRANYKFKHCDKDSAYSLGCLVALRESESSKYAWLSDLVVFMILVTIANTIVSLLLFGLSKTDIYSDNDEHELGMVGASATPRPSIAPTMTGMRHRPSVVQTLGPDVMNARAQAVRFNISTTPRSSISGPSKFSAAARRGSSFI